MDFVSKLISIFESTKKGHLHQQLWPDGKHIDGDVRIRLDKIANDFINDHEIPSEAIIDIILTGSMANYNWTSYSDIDLHILVDFEQQEECEHILSDYYNVAKSLWNDKHHITIFDHEVEIYVQDSNEAHYSTGVYSLKKNKWITKPSKEQTSIKPNQEAVERKARRLASKVSSINASDKDAESQAKKLMQYIKDMRMEGLRNEGEYSIENLAFKYLRNKGYLEKLSSLSIKSYDHKLSVK